MAIQSVEREALLALVHKAPQNTQLPEGVDPKSRFMLMPYGLPLFLLGMRTGLGIGNHVAVFGPDRPEKLNDTHLPFTEARYAVFFTTEDSSVDAMLLQLEGMGNDGSAETYHFVETVISEKFAPNCLSMAAAR